MKSCGVRRDSTVAFTECVCSTAPISRRRVPIFDNDQDIARLAAKVQPWLQAHPDCVGYLIRGHGLYTWGARMSDALRQIEAFEFLFECELKVRSLSNHKA